MEFALALPFLMAFIFFIIDAGFFAYTYVSMTNAVREGARCAVVGGTDAAVIQRVTDASGGLTKTITVTSPIVREPNIGGNVKVEAKYTYDWITPVGILPFLNLTDTIIPKSASMRMETAPPYGKISC